MNQDTSVTADRALYEKPVLSERAVEELVQLGAGPVADSCCCCLQAS